MEIETVSLKTGQGIPNNPTLPVVIYRNVTDLSGYRDPATFFEGLFGKHQWGGSWRNGVFPYHHYHSTAHEVLGCFAGHARIQVGGTAGVVFTLTRGDAVLLPAGTGHKNLGASAGFGVVGAYPSGQHHDLLGDDPATAASATETISAVPRPAFDPILGNGGPWGDIAPATDAPPSA